MKVYVCDIFDRVERRVLYAGIDYEECAGDAYDHCMKEMARLDDDNRYEFSCVEEIIDFQWSMTPNDFNTFRSMHERMGTLDYCGGLYFGFLKLEFMHIDEWNTYLNCFRYGQKGYGELANGVPYDEYCGFADQIDIPERRTFPAFARCVEREVIKVLNEYSQLVDDAIRPTNPGIWHRDAQNNTIFPAITRRA